MEIEEFIECFYNLGIIDMFVLATPQFDVDFITLTIKYFK